MKTQLDRDTIAEEAIGQRHGSAPDYAPTKSQEEVALQLAPIGFPLGALLARSGDAALIRHEKEQNLTPPSSFSRNDSPAVFVSATPNLLEVSR